MCCKWFSIETAPKGEKWKRPKILLWNGQEVCIGHWDADEYSKKPRPFWSYTGSLGKNSDRASQPTHWMPLPVAPGSAPPAPTASPASGVGVALERSDGKGGWTIAPSVLEEIQKDAGEWAEESYLETVEAIALATEQRIRSALVASPEN